MAWTHMPRQQQRGAQMQNRDFAKEHAADGSAPKEVVQDRDAQQHDYADLQLGGEPRSDIDYPADSIPDRAGDITPTLPDGDTQSWDDVVQPENHSRDGDKADRGQSDLPLPEGK